MKNKSSKTTIKPKYFDNREQKIFKLDNGMRIFIVSDKEASLSAVSLEINYGGLGSLDTYDNYSEDIKKIRFRFPYYNKYDNLPGMAALLSDIIIFSRKKELDQIFTTYSGVFEKNVNEDSTNWKC